MYETGSSKQPLRIPSVLHAALKNSERSVQILLLGSGGL